MTAAVAYTICGVCATPREQGARCPNCGSDAGLGVRNGYVITFPAETLACAGCGSTDRQLDFRMWTRVVSLLIWAQERAHAGYVCADCNRREAAKSMLFTALLGWWSVPSWLWVGWRSTYRNWRAVFVAPHNPYEWGALSATAFTDAVREQEREHEREVAEDVIQASPLRFLTHQQQQLVLQAEGLYGLLDIADDATKQEIRRAYRDKARGAHPDLNAEVSAAAMVELNQAWEILSNDQLRVAYDWTLDHIEVDDPRGA